MNFSQYLTYLPYQLAWHLHKAFHRSYQVDFYCGGYVDYICFKNIHRQLPQIRIVAKNQKTKQELAVHGITSVVYPTFPDLIIMARHLARKFPVASIRKIGMRHGAYHFKDFIDADKYNDFDAYLLTSTQEVQQAAARGITSGKAIGFPKIDCMFNGEITGSDLSKLAATLQLNPKKKTVIFTATWDKNGYSAVDKWISRIDELSADYNVLVTVHQWLTPKKKGQLAKSTKVHFITDMNILPYLMLADVMIADISSIIAEFCALNKPIITFRIAEIRRFTSEISTMLDEISYRIDSFEELPAAIARAVTNPDELADKRIHYNRVMFDDLDGKASDRAVQLIQTMWGRA